jgi:hypothetical protein
MKKLAVSFLAGLLFAVGLAVSGMTQPAKVIGFLDLTGRWDASLAFVMAGAVGLNIVLFRFILARRAPVLDDRFHLPSARGVDARLLGGAALFGVGWGIAGYCPGPAVVSAAGGHLGPVLFVLAMLAGVAAQHVADGVLRARRAQAAAPDSLGSPTA